MSDNVLQTLQTAIQDVIAPDVRELKVRMAAFEKQSETQFQALRELIHSVLQQQEATSKALLAAFGEAKAKQELENYKLYAALSERVTALESARQ